MPEQFPIPNAIITEVGDGKVRLSEHGAQLSLPPLQGETYHNAQISDYGRARDFRHQPPLKLHLRAHASDTADNLRGTAGFGFWNHPFAPNERGWRLPAAVWFFFSAPPSNMPLALNVRGYGWKAATFDARRSLFYSLLPLAPLGVLLMRAQRLYHRLWPIGQRALGVHEALLPSHYLAESHSYTITWLPQRVIFTVDEQTVLEAEVQIRGALGFVAWMDNQYAVVTPQGRFRFGLVPIEQAQSLTIEHITIERL
ncbi:MAG: hypothetical protein D6712_13430 [Chloroflexi bacterium]|nr:MAG: hypothetical protein D6712_13430 [Chloroflexota bacterium]